MNQLEKNIKKALVFALFLSLSILSTATPMTSKDNRPLKEDCKPEQVSEWLQTWTERMEKDTDEFPDIIQELSLQATSCTDLAMKALIHSMLAEMYSTYYIENRWAIDSRSLIEGETPQDMRIWSSNLFETTIASHLKQSIEPKDALLQLPIDIITSLLTREVDEPPIEFDSVYDFLMWRAVNMEFEDESIGIWMNELESKTDKRPYILLKIKEVKSNYKKGLYADKETYDEVLESLYEEHKDSPWSVEIFNEIVDYLKDDSMLQRKYQELEAIIERFPDYPRIDLLKNKRTTFTAPYIHIRTPWNVYPNEEIAISLSYRNVRTLSIDINESTDNPLDLNSRGKPNIAGKLIKRIMLALPDQAPYQSTDTTIHVRIGKAGQYLCTFSSDEYPEINGRTEFSISKLGLMSRQIGQDTLQAVVVDFLSGKPIEHATVSSYTNDNSMLKKESSQSTNKNGIAAINIKNPYFFIRATTPGDTSGVFSRLYQNHVGTEIKKEVSLSLLTDRKIYRPGQVVYVKGIAYQQEKEASNAITDKTFVLTLQDASGKNLHTQTVRSNAYGSFSTEFTIPHTTPIGWFQITNKYETTSFRVEEYKRPTFLVELDSIKERATFNQTVHLEGTAQTYTGTPLSEGKVRYEIFKRPMPWLRNYPWGGSFDRVDTGEITLGKDGRFNFLFTPKATDKEMEYPIFFGYEVRVNITDSKGETQEGLYQFSIGNREFSLQTSINSKVEKDSLDIIVNAQTLNGEQTTASGTWKLIQLSEREKDYYPYKEGAVVLEGEFRSNEKIPASTFASIPAGRYRLKLKSVDNNNRPVEYETNFILFDKDDKRPPIHTSIWIEESTYQAAPGEEITYRFGTSLKNTYVLHEIYSKTQLIKQTWIRVNNEIETLRFIYPQEADNELTASFAFIKEGKAYREEIIFKKTKPNKQLTFKPVTFRDHLFPGQRETWTFKIMDAQGNPIKAEVLASMYDVSLDKIQPFNWHFSPLYQQNTNYRNYYLSGKMFDSNYDSAQDNWREKLTHVPEHGFYQFNWMNFKPFIQSTSYSVSLRTGSMISETALESKISINLDQSTAQNAPPSPPKILDQTANNGQSIRQNFQETAFFYPHLIHQDSVSFTFVLPESNTSWKLQMLAHTDNMDYGMHTAQITASKPIMVAPNLPRFVREGDEVSIATQVINSLDNGIKGSAHLSLFDPISGQPLPIVTDSIASFTVEANSSAALSWKFTIPKSISLLGVKIIADTDQASDGEQHLIPVLPEEVLVTESKPFFLTEEKETTLILPDFSKGNKKPLQATVEMTSNPVWYAIQALPALSTPTNEDVISWMGTYYASTLTKGILLRNQDIRNVIANWQVMNEKADASLANLEKNEELKSISLEETPWRTAAMLERENKQKLFLLFDKNRTEVIRDEALNKLIELQKGDGSWSWYKDFSPSPSITIEILRMMAELTELGAVEYKEVEKKMQTRALRYIDNYMGERYREKTTLKQSNFKLTALIIDYLYMRSFYRDIPETESGRKASHFYISLINEQWNKPHLGLQEKGKLAIFLYRNGDKELAQEITSWLRRTATMNNKGMYWANNRGNREGLNGSAINTHSILMRALGKISPNQEETDRMKQWLISQKRVQDWTTTPATLAAIYQLIETGSDWLKEKNSPTITWGETKLELKPEEATTGYIKRAVDGDLLTPDMQKLYIHSSGDAPSWGAVYVQYFQPVSEVNASASSGLSVEKQLYKEVNEEGKIILRPIDEQSPLQVGDRVTVRMVVRASDHFDYVHLKDLRPACFEPINQASRYEFIEGNMAYHASKDASEEYFFEHLKQGILVIEYQAYVNREGHYSGGMTTIQSQYAPEFTQHTSGEKIETTRIK